MFPDADPHVRPQQIVKTLRRSPARCFLQERVAVLTISFLSQVRCDFRQIDWKTQAFSSNRRRVKDIRQRIGRVCRRLSANESAERNGIAKLEITILD